MTKMLLQPAANGIRTLLVRLRYIKEYRDRHGHVRRYFRRRGQPEIALPGRPGSSEFVAAYNAALAAMAVARPTKPAPGPGSVSAAVALYYTSYAFLGLAPSTRQMRRPILERFRIAHGDKRLAEMQRPHVARILAAQKPFAARNWLKTLRGLMEFAAEIGLRPDDPTAGIAPAAAREGRIHTWTEEEIAQFEAAHPIGSRPRLAMALLLYSGQRRSDVVRMGPQHVRGARLSVRQQKTRAELVIPLHDALRAVLEATSTGHLAFLVTTAGKPFSAAGFGNAFREWCDAAGLRQCSSHGLRKAQCRRLAEAGCTAPEIAAISGHKSLREVQRYIEGADQERLAVAAMAKVSGTPDKPKVSNRER
jgi:integrase